jgi:predicted RNase H-like HicB family nuclease
MKKANKVLSYYAVYEPAAEGGYNVSFPNFPGCVTYGRSFEHAKEMAEEVLKMWLEVMDDQKKDYRVYDTRPILDEVKVAMPA